jgi:hypothetical protein
LSLHKCLDTFSASEAIKEAYCSKCKEHRNASLKTELWRLPPVLMVLTSHTLQLVTEE